MNLMKIAFAFLREIVGVLAVILIIALVIILIVNSLYYLVWNSKVEERSTYLNFFQWRRLYQISPDKWKFCPNDFLDDTNRLWYYPDNMGKIQIRFRFFSFLCLSIWRFWHFIRKTKEKNNMYLVAVLEDCQRDIDVLKKKAEKEISSALEQQKEIFEKMV